jgi:hypothetical protein
VDAQYKRLEDARARAPSPEMVELAEAEEEAEAQAEAERKKQEEEEAKGKGKGKKGAAGRYRGGHCITPDPGIVSSLAPVKEEKLITEWMPVFCPDAFRPSIAALCHTA